MTMKTQNSKAAPTSRNTSIEPSKPGSFFSHHGPWAFGVRLFRTLRFASKAGLISLAFLVPMLLLTVAYLRTSQATIDFAVHEQAGVAVIAKLEPWLIEVQKQRRLVLSGLAPSIDWDAISARLKEVRAVVEAQADGLDLRREMANVEQQHQSLQAQSAASNPDAIVTNLALARAWSPRLLVIGTSTGPVTPVSVLKPFRPASSTQRRYIYVPQPAPLRQPQPPSSSCGR